ARAPCDPLGSPAGGPSAPSGPAQKGAAATSSNMPRGWVRKNGSVPKTSTRAPLSDTAETTDAWPAACSGPPVPSPVGSQWPLRSGRPAATVCPTVTFSPRSGEKAGPEATAAGAAGPAVGPGGDHRRPARGLRRAAGALLGGQPVAAEARLVGGEGLLERDVLPEVAEEGRAVGEGGRLGLAGEHAVGGRLDEDDAVGPVRPADDRGLEDRKSTRL